MDCDDFEKTLKVIVVGNGNVGKTSMTTRYAKGKYTGNYKKTIGVDFMEKSVELRDLGETVNLMIWDTAGQEEFDTLTSRYYKGAGAVIYVFSTVDRDSFDDLPKWKRKVEEECGRICHVLVQNKIDLVEDAAMSRAEVEDMADYMNIRLFRSCVQDNVNVKEVFEHLCRQFLKYGGSGGSDDTLSAVADITSLSELASRSGDERSGSGHYHHATGGKGSERRSKREVSDISDTGSEQSEQPQQQRTTGARGPSEKPFPPSVPASITKDRANEARYGDDADDSSEHESSDGNTRGKQRGSRDRRQDPRRHKDVERDYDNDTGDDEDASPRRHRPKTRDGDSSHGKRNASRKSDRSNARRAADDAAGHSSSSSASKTNASADAQEDRHRSVKQDESDRDAQNERTRSSGAESDRDDTTNAPTRATATALAHEPTDAVRHSSNGGDRDEVSESTTASSASKIQPSKRRTNGKKRQTVPECVLS